MPILAFVELHVLPAADCTHPARVREIPRDDLGQRIGEVVLRLPAELAARLAAVDRVAPVVTGSIGDVADEGAGRARLPPELPIDVIADRFDDGEVALLVVATDAVSLAGDTPLQHAQQRA